MVDQLTRNGSAHDEDRITALSKTSLYSNIKHQVNQRIYVEHNSRWMELRKCETQNFFTSLDKSRSRDLLGKTRITIRKLIATTILKFFSSIGFLLPVNGRLKIWYFSTKLEVNFWPGPLRCLTIPKP